ncbi:hypothetical protein [Streptomyces sp. V4I2]|nr:hypothetical protein [Streptomyces sp. V4I2]MDQ1050221.1 putative cupin superfamily protein [Streptomyces sp. V4I2]
MPSHLGRSPHNLSTAGSRPALRADDRTTWTVYETLRKVYAISL